MELQTAVILIGLFVSYCAVDVVTKGFNLLVIPLSRVALEPYNRKGTNPIDFTNKNKRKEVRQHRTNDRGEVDLEDYKLPTDLPDIDNFDYNDRNIARSSEVGSLDEYDSLDEDRIVGGYEVDINLYPYHVGYGNNCGGAIIGKNWVITAGHCGKKSYIRAGSKYINEGKRIGVKMSYIHPGWVTRNKEHPFDFDFQLLELEEPLRFDDSIQAVKIAHIEDMVIGKVITVTGWGNTEENGPFSQVLRAVRVPVISKEKCQNVPFPYFRGGLTDRMFCAGFTEGKKDACQGDSGGPAVSNDRLLGMVSFGYGCATPGSYGVYSKVAKVRSWIEEVTDLKLD